MTRPRRDTAPNSSGGQQYVTWPQLVTFVTKSTDEIKRLVRELNRAVEAQRAIMAGQAGLIQDAIREGVAPIIAAQQAHIEHHMREAEREAERQDETRRADLGARINIVMMIATVIATCAAIVFGVLALH